MAQIHSQGTGQEMLKVHSLRHSVNLQTRRHSSCGSNLILLSVLWQTHFVIKFMFQSDNSIKDLWVVFLYVALIGKSVIMRLHSALPTSVSL